MEIKNNGIMGVFNYDSVRTWGLMSHGLIDWRNILFLLLSSVKF